LTKEKLIKTSGIVLETLPNATFRIELTNGRRVLAHVCGKMRLSEYFQAIKLVWRFLPMIYRGEELYTGKEKASES